MTRFQVSYHLEMEAETPEAAALEVARLLLTERPKDFAVTAPHQPTVFIRVEREKAKRVA